MSPSIEGISRFFVEHAYSEAGGRNIVNVILVDFRAFDTFGEITVLGIVGLTVFALLRRFRPANDTLDDPGQKRVQDAADRRRENRVEGDTLRETMLVPRVVMRWMFPFVLLLAIHLFLRGHDLPGGGFAAGVTLYGTDPIRLAYRLRAVTPGSFAHPAATVEDMYRHERPAWTDSGATTITR